MALAQAGARVVILSSSEDKLSNAADEMNSALKEESKKGSVEFEAIDLADLKNTDKVAKELAKKLDRLDLLIANAGVGQVSFRELIFLPQV